MSKPTPSWVVPITADTSPDVHRCNLTAVISIDDRKCVELGTDRPGGPLLVMTPLEAAQLSLALQDAAKEAGMRRAKAGR